ncbi:RNA 2',3'-cyclic phosphodiesterase [Ruania zhangjianzhongii]|uniref:RNA 2',3'-cyclic phosphodiesterase n=1 Tax=Ruania zhangjianzhongii TaxID=2603206 RepID=UPI0011C9142F|nr:RNA 2',3'-cyclic phosphodiesterase [Ruania zhangjianzhongii]
MRLFAAIRPPEAALDHLESALAPLHAGAGDRLRWLPREQLHLTVAFYGDVPDGAAPDLQTALASAVAGSGELRLALRGAGTFSSRNLWVGLAGQVQDLRELMAVCAQAPLTAGGEARPPRPHLTVARAGRRARELDVRPLARALAVYSGPEWTADQVRLVSSRLGEGPGGSVAHEVIGAVDL